MKTLVIPPPSPPLFSTSSFSGYSFRRFFWPKRASCSSSNSRRLASQLPAAVRVEDGFTKYSGYVFELTPAEEETLAEYNIAKIAAIYQKKPLLVLRRLFQIGSTLGKWFALRYIDTVSERADDMFKIRAEELRKILVQLGPAYVKIAQAVSSRPDLIPPSYLDELSLLQDQITPFPNEVAFGTIEQELGLPLDELFSEVSAEPVAAASLGQVYQARLQRSGKIVAVKVQRPGVQAAISLDILILRFLAGLVRKAGKFNTDLQAVVDEWASSLFREMDYEREASNAIKFRKLYGGIKDVMVPEMYVPQTTRKVLTMQWVEVGVYCSFNQLLEYGFYHADPHPGNLLRTYDGKLAYLDFGMMGEFKQEFRDGFIEACLHLVNRDYDALAKDFVTLGLLPPTADKDAVTKALTGVFQDVVARGVQNISFGDLLTDLGFTMYKFKFRIPSYFSLVIRRIDRMESLISESLRARMERTLKKTDVSETRVIIKQILAFTLDEKGTFVREVLLDELAKGLDALGLATLESVSANLPFSSSDSFSSMTDEDIMNLRNLQRLVLFLQGLDKRPSMKVNGINAQSNQRELSNGVPFALNQFESAQELLPLLSVIPELPQDMQQKLLLLPGDLVGKLASRVAARTLRRIFL
nr:uncharacterized aarF domain-containing protein kinase At1g71810, chloroplastic isoform X1 [Ipomoea batatas]